VCSQQDKALSRRYEGAMKALVNALFKRFEGAIQALFYEYALFNSLYSGAINALLQRYYTCMREALLFFSR
jgi:hypothetical protein